MQGSNVVQNEGEPQTGPPNSNPSNSNPSNTNTSSSSSSNSNTSEEIVEEQGPPAQRNANASGGKGVTLTPNAEGDITVDSWQGLQDAINSVENGKTIFLSNDVTAGDGNGTLAVKRGGVSFAIDLAGHTINRNLTSQNDENNGHVFDVNEGTLTIRDSSADKTGKICGGFDENGGGIIIGGSGHLIVESGAITGNSAINGGGIFVYGELVMTGGSVTGNTGEDCGGIYNYGGTITLGTQESAVTISNNTARSAGGGGINNKGTATLTKCVISNNAANAEGGGIYSGPDTNLTATDCSFTGNTTNSDGGALCSYGTSTLTDCTLNENKAKASGGAIRVYGGAVVLNGATLNKNTAEGYGGGIFCNNDGVLKVLSSSSITGNVAYKGGGGVFVANQMREVHVGSGVEVKDNQANNIYLTGDRQITVDEPLSTNTNIGVSLENLGGTFTTNFNATNPSTDPASVFLPEPGYSILPDGNGEARVVTSDWVQLQALIAEAGNGATIVLDRNWQAADENTALVIPADKSITIDLNGHTIDRHRSSFTDGGEVFTVSGTLGIVDNSYDKDGAVRGGYGAGGGFVVKSGGTLTLHNGTITGNHGKDGGGGVRVEGGGEFETFGGSITGNVSDADGGGVYNGGTFTNAVCTISNNTSGGMGGGVYTSGSATFNSGSVSSNTSNGSGGGICVDAGTLDVKQNSPAVSISSNTAKSGGGGGMLVRGGTATLNACEITGNSISDPDGRFGDGGGVYILAGSTASFNGGTITGNYASNHGGGVYVSYLSAGQSNALSVSGAIQVTNNTATIGKNILGSGETGWLTIGGALDSSARLDVMTSEPEKPITSGFTSQGCSIDCFTTNDTDHSQLEVRNDELYIKQAEGGTRVTAWAQLQEAINNAASGETIVLDGNVMAMEGDTRLIVEDGKNITIDLNGKQLHRNASEPEDSDGRVLEVDDDSTLTIKDSIGAGIILGGYANNGGGIYIHEGSTVNLLGGAVMNNRATEDGGGIYVVGTLNACGGVVARNMAGDNGGGIYVDDDGNLSMQKTVVSNNTSHNEGGGLDIRAERDGITLTQCQIRDNKAEDDHGGGIFLSESSLLLTLQDCVVDNNLSDGSHEGGGIYVDDGRLVVNGGTISRNRAKNGGGIYNDECAITLDGVTLSENTTYDDGKGAGIFNGGSCQTSGCTFNGNAAEGFGGGIYTEGDDYLTVTNCTFQSNESKESYGGAVYAHRATTLTGCTFTGNKAYVSGGGLYVDCDTSVVGGTFSQNEAVSHGGAICVSNDSTLRLDGSGDHPITVTNNEGTSGGSGIFAAGGSHYLSMQGSVTVKDNVNDDFRMEGDKCIDVVGKLDGSQVRMTLERDTGVFTINYSNFESGVAPSTFFSAKVGYAVIPADQEAQIVASDWVLLQKMIDDAADGATITLDRDWRAAPQNLALSMPAGKSVTIDLNGHTIDRARTEYSAGGEVFNVSGGLVITDTSEGKAGKICGGYGDGGGFVVANGGAISLQGGNITGNRAKAGGGVLVAQGGQLNMSGGSIAGNTVEGDGGGVHCSGTFALTGGQITGNEASGSGGGAWVANGSTFSVGGSPKIIDNTASVGRNLYMASEVVMGVTQKLENEARIDLVAQSPTRALTSGLTNSGSADVALTVFSYDGVTTDRLVVRDGELYVIQPSSEVMVGDWEALQNAINDDANRDKVIRLANDITADEDDDCLLLENGRNVIVDLNGHALDRHLDDDDDDGHVFWITGGSTLTIKDTAGTGRVTGGYAEHGGAINIQEGSTCNVEGGTFTGNRASEEGGAFFVYGTLNMTGGTITRNSTPSGGGIFVHENGTINLTNVILVSNEANKWGGGAINNKGNATLTNCVIKENWADNEGGAIYNGDKSLVINNCTITQNSSSAGGGLCCYGTTTITDTTISNNYGDDYGGGLCTRGVVTITGGTIANNVGKADGGGIYNLGGLLTVSGTTLTGNSTEAGGGALNNKGTATLTSCTLNGSHSNMEGGCIYAGVDSGTTVDGCTLQGNSAGKDGGAIAACGVMEVKNSTITQNTTDGGGGGVYSNGDTTIANTKISENSAKESGGALLARTRTITLDSVTATKNAASSLGGGLMVEGGSDAVVIKGKVVMKENEGSGDAYLSDGKVFTLGAALQNDANAPIFGVRTQNGLGVVFTSGYAQNNPSTDPASFFFSNDGYTVYLEGSEVSTKKDAIDANPFIDAGSQVNGNVDQLTGVDWMSGLSGERRLNEINLPGTHDSGTKEVQGNLSTGKLAEYCELGGAALGFLLGTATLGIGGGVVFGLLGSDVLAEDINDYATKFAYCQTRYIDEQLEDGIRCLDIRLNTYYVEPGWPVRPKQDNGEDLYLCHGKDDTGGTYFAMDRRNGDEYLTFRKVLSWIKAFLEEHPTETIMMNTQVESVDDVYDEAMARIRKHLREELATQINPSTGKPYLYMEDGVFGRRYTEYPELKNCRGQVVLECGDSEAEILGGLVKGVGLSGVESPEGDYKDNAPAKIRNLRKFFSDHGYNDLPRTAQDFIDYLYSVGLNGTDSRTIPEITPLEIAKDVLEVMFGEDGLVIDKAGKYIGLINMDGENAEYSKNVWSSNFFDAKEYCTVTVKNGLADEITKTYTVEYGTLIPIPECIFDNPNAEGKYFKTWEGKIDNSVSGNTWYCDPGESYGIIANTTFTALWDEQPYTSTSVLWRDGGNKDGLRLADKLTIKVRGSDGSQTPVDVMAAKNWKVSIPGDIKPDDITVDWDRIGEDTDGQYACEVRNREGGSGIVIELTHTPQKNIQAKGTVNWVDNDDAGGKRPSNVTVHLLADSRVVDSTTIDAKSGWKWDFGERPAYVDGQEVYYSVEEDPIEGYDTYTKGFDITNVLGGAKVSTEIRGLVRWVDHDNAGNSRPKNVTINLLKDGKQIDKQVVSRDAQGHWIISFEVPGTTDENDYTITEDAVEGYATVIRSAEETGGLWLVTNVLENHEHQRETLSSVVAQPTCTQKGLRKTIECCEECGEIFLNKKEDVPATGHDWDDWQTLIDATEVHAGLETRYCKNDKSHVQTRIIPKTGHDHTLVKVDAKAATCTEDGNIEYWTCAGGNDPCGMCFEDEAATKWIHQEGTVVHALGHEWGEWEVTQEPTELTWGTERRVCAHNAAHVVVRVIPKTGHAHGLKHVKAKAATCTEDGNVEYWQCAEGKDPCGMYFLDAMGTEWVHQEGTVAHATGHDWGTWRITKAPSESEEGEEVRVCHNDPSHIQTRKIPKVGHVHALTKVKAKPATCTENGNIEYWECTGGESPCGMRFKDAGGVEWVHDEGVVIHALGHEWGEATYAWSDNDTKVTATRVCLRDSSHKDQETVAAGKVEYVLPTCTQPGKTLVTSQLFTKNGFVPQSKQGPDVPALGHEWGEWKVTKPATETEEGEEARTCARCGETETCAIPAKAVYRYVGPEGQSWTRGGITALQFTFKRSFKDELTFGLFAGIQVDGKTVPQKDASGKVNYEAQAGSLVLRLQPSYLESLAVGSHTVTAVFEDGSASAEFVVKAASPKDKDNKDNPSGGSVTSAQSTRISTPKTGDATSAVAVVAMAVAGALALVASAIARRRRKA